MDGMTPSVRNFTIRILRGLFNFGIRRGYCTENPVRRLDRAQREPTEIQIYSVQEVASILTAAQAYAPSSFRSLQFRSSAVSGKRKPCASTGRRSISMRIG